MGVYLARNHFNAPIVLAHPGVQWLGSDKAVGGPVNPAVVPTLLANYGPHMGFTERLMNTLTYGYLHYVTYYLAAPHFERAARSLLNIDESPNLLEIHHSASFLLRVSHPVLEDGYPENPNTASVAGMQARPPRPIKDLELRNWLDEAATGVFLVSFGSVSIIRHVLQ